MKTFAAIVMMVLISAAPALAKGPQGVRYTVHNMANELAGVPFSLAPNISMNEDEICIFCHTPHGGQNTGPLWNRDMAAFDPAGYTHYNSARLSSEISSSRVVSNESLLCLSCHDGSVALNQIMNISNDIAALPDNAWKINPGFGGPGPRIGAGTPDPWASTTDLGDDHPISFSYYDVYNAAPYTTTKVGQLHSGDVARSNGVRFFGAENTAGGDRLECSSCHDPHVSYDKGIYEWVRDVGPGIHPGDTYDAAYRPFLITPNTGSALCLACHNK